MASQFALDLEKFKAKTMAQIELTVKKIVFELFTLIIQRSPVETGRFRANNQISLNNLSPDAIMLLDRSGAMTISTGTTVLGEYKLGDTVFIYNNVGYAMVIEYGRADGKPGSQQAPQGVYRISVSDIRSYVDSIVKP